jgi:acyl-CoA reductase-like NAD-dependent aldehyde dehydrogenase
MTASVFTVLDPATGQACGEAPVTTLEGLDAAVDAARRAQPAWAADEAGRRGALDAAADRLDAATDELSALLTAEQGKPLHSAASEVAASAYWLRAFAAMPLTPEPVPEAEPERVVVEHRPVGVVAAITPWNFPLLLACWKLAPALLAGNAVVVKPSPETPLATLRLEELLRDVLPPGVLAVVGGGATLGGALVAHPGVRKVSFTGSTESGRAVAAAAAPGLKRVTLELGGNDAAIILDDADPAAIADDLFWSAFANCGQICAAVKRVFVARPLAEALTEALAALATDVRVGPGTQPDVQLGPLTTRAQFLRVQELVDQARAGGARAVAGGQALDGPGNFFAPTILTGTPDTARVVAEEQFGPVLPILPYDTIDEAVTRANATPFGLCGSVWGTDDERARQVAQRLECGTAYVNAHGGITPYQPFGGIRDSGVGVEQGRLGLQAYCDVRVTASPARA